jgi:poly(A) polymerase
MLKTLQLSSNNWIDDDALQIVENLTAAKFRTYLVGGCVRDYLAGVPPKDFDIVTEAKPQDVKKNVRKAYIIGKRFRLVLVQRQGIQYEVATFRRDPTKAEKLDEDISNDNLFGEPEQDALRRDFTINAMFYDPSTKTVLDYAGGLEDIDSRSLRMIGDPVERILEDPVRILRALRLSHKLHFQIEPSLRKAIEDNHECLKEAALPRIREDLLKILRLPSPERCLIESYDLGVVKTCFPLLHDIFSDDSTSDLFELTLARSYQVVEDSCDPKELYIALVYSILKALSHEKDTPVWDDDLFEEIYPALKNQFGIFKSEIEFVRNTIQMVPAFMRLENFLKRGRKRQASFLSNECFPYALKLAHWDYYIDTDTSFSWRDMYRRELPKMVQKDIEKLKTKYRRRN